MPALLSHYRPNNPIYVFTENKEIQRRLALYHGVLALHMNFSQEADETFDRWDRCMLLFNGLCSPGASFDVTCLQGTPSAGVGHGKQTCQASL